MDNYAHRRKQADDEPIPAGSSLGLVRVPACLTYKMTSKILVTRSVMFVR